MLKNTKAKEKYCRRRIARGITLTELVMSAVLLGFSMAVIAEIMSVGLVSSTRLERQFDTQMASRSALDRIKRDVRMATVICPGNNPGADASSKRCLLEDCDHGTSELTLNSHMLILHLPILFLDKTNDSNDPAYVPNGPLNPRNGVRVRGYETVIYTVVADNEDPGKYKMLMTVVPPPNYVPRVEGCTYRTAIVDSTVAKGIIGPHSSAGEQSVPDVFKYVSKNPLVSLGRPGRLDMLSPTAVSMLEVMPHPEISEAISGVSVDCEFSKGSSATDPTLRTSAVHAETSIRLPLRPYGYPQGSYYE